MGTTWHDVTRPISFVPNGHRGLVHLEHVRLAANHLAQRGVRGDHALVVQPEGSGHGRTKFHVGATKKNGSLPPRNANLRTKRARQDLGSGSYCQLTEYCSAGKRTPSTPTRTHATARCVSVGQALCHDFLALMYAHTALTMAGQFIFALGGHG